jgi:hypothetical protein
VALTNSYNTEVVGSPPVPTAGDHYAITAYESFPAGGLNKWYSRVGALGPFRAGDQIFWHRGSIIAPLSHVAIVLADLGPGVEVMSQNTNGHRYAERTVLPRAGVAGALRPITPGSVDGLARPVSLLDAVPGVAGAGAVWGKILAWITAADNWKRIGIALLGIILIMVALVRILNFHPVTAASGLLKAKP